MANRITMAERGQIEEHIAMAVDLAENLECCGHEDIVAVDLLDCLASVGLRLVRDEGCICRVSLSSASYFYALAPTAFELVT